MSKEALHNSLELANSKFPPRPILSLTAVLSLKPFPSSKFFFTLSLGSGETFLASAPLKKFFPQHAFKKKKNQKRKAKISLKNL